jgi:hypothetical protein
MTVDGILCDFTGVVIGAVSEGKRVVTRRPPEHQEGPTLKTGRLMWPPALVVLGMLALCSTGVRGQTFVTEPAPVNSDAGGLGLDYRYPVVAMAPYQDVVVAWSDYTHIRAATSPDFGASWSNQSVVGTSTLHFLHKPAIASTATGELLLAWCQFDVFPGWYGDIYVAGSADNGQTWGPPIKMSSAVSSIEEEGPTVGTDGSGCWIVAWRSNDDLGGTIGTDFDILCARTTDNGQNWTVSYLNTDAPSDTFEDDSSVFVAPLLRTDGMGHWVAVWPRHLTGGPDELLAVAHSSDNGITWSPPAVLLTVPWSGTSSSLLGYDLCPGNTLGEWFLAWSYQGIHVSRSLDHGMSWSPLTSFAGQGLSPTMATDGVAACLVVWQESSILLASRSGDDGLNWSSPSVLNPSPQMSAGNHYSPAAATDGLGTWMVTWSSDNDLGGTIGSDDDILFTRGVGPCPTSSLSLTPSNPTPTSYLIVLTAAGFTPGSPTFTCFTYQAGEHPAGPWFGIDPLYEELAVQATMTAPPFNGTFDAAGTSTYAWTCLGTPGPLGITLYAVTIEHAAGAILRASPPISATL